MDKYDPHAVEAKWQRIWEETGIYRTPETGSAYYCLDFFPYPSGEGLSVGHCRNYVPTDVISRYHRMRGDAVLHPMGWDAFGLPAENEAILQGVHPQDSTRRYAANYKHQMQILGTSYDWSREITSSDPEFYRWTQWFFLLLYKRGLAYRGAAPVNWCETDQTVLANEEIENGTCWRCHNPVTQRVLTQWFFRITAYAQQLLDDLTQLDWPEHIVTMQRNWIRGMRDWLISRQRYWGVPIPILYCRDCGTVPVPEADLPVRLPHLPDYAPRGDGRSPLANVPEFVHTTCPQCSGPAERETDTMSGFACSSWYFLRFASPHYTAFAFEPEAVRRWLPVDLYVGGAEHAVAHLLYARFWTKVLRDAGLIDFGEPFPVLRSQGVLHAPDGKRMSKSRRNVVTPESVSSRYGADALRLHLLFMAPFEAPVIWSEEGIAGPVHFLRRVWGLVEAARAGTAQDSHPELSEGAQLSALRNRVVQRITQDIEAFKLNTAVSALMEYAGALEDHRAAVGVSDAYREALRTLLLLLAPFAPHIAEELWQRLGEPYSIHQQPWPIYDPAAITVEMITLLIQVNGKVRDRLEVRADVTQEQAQAAALASAAVQRHLKGREPRRIIYVPGRLVNIVIQGDGN